MLDVGHTSYLAEQLARDKRLKEQHKAFDCDSKLSTVCRKMHEIGMAMDTVERDYQYAVKTREMEQYQKEARVWAMKGLEGIEDVTPGAVKLAEHLNPNSPDQLRKYLFEVCGIVPISEREGGVTKTGDPSTSKDVLFALIDKGLPNEIEEFLLRVIDYKEASKLRGTYCTVEVAKDTGRVHPGWSPHVVVSGRLACSKPNVMNVPYSMRGIYCAGPGHVLVAQDKSGLEARLGAILSGLRWQIELFKNGGDLHATTARMVLGIPDDEELPDKKRKFAKTLRFAFQYGAKPKKGRQMIRNFRDPKTGIREFREFSLAQAEKMYKEFWGTHKELMQFHEANIEFWEENGYIAEPLHGRRRCFLDGGGDESIKEEMMNWGVQPVASADVNDATFRLVEEYPWGFDGPNTGLVHQCHDALMVECREENAEKVAMRMQEVLYAEVGEMPLPVDIGIGKSWGTLQAYKRVGDHLERAE
jgi:DNA polymerase-1